jgi:hypothetical protein
LNCDEKDERKALKNGVISQKKTFFIATAEKTSNLVRVRFLQTKSEKVSLPVAIQKS